jgi:CRISPR-associated protein Cas5d
VIEAIYWKPEIRWVIDRLTVLRPIRFHSLRRNEVSSKISKRSAAEAMNAGGGDIAIYVEDDRQQRAALLLRNVAYLIEAHFEILNGESNEAKHLDQFNRRARAGQCHTRPYFGCREFAAHFSLIEKEESLPRPDASLAGERDLGWMLHDIDFKNKRQPIFFHATMRDGTIEVPAMTGGQA